MESPTQELASSMPSAPRSPEKQAEIDDLARAIREAVDAEIKELAASLATADDAHVFGDNEFRIRALPTRSPPSPSSSGWRKKNGYEGASVTARTAAKRPSSIRTAPTPP